MTRGPRVPAIGQAFERSPSAWGGRCCPCPVELFNGDIFIMQRNGSLPPPPRGNRMVLEARLSRETPILKLSSQEADLGGVRWESVLFW